MSKRTMFHHGPPDGLLSLILKYSARFTQWYETTMREYPEDDMPEETLTLGRAIAAGDASLLLPTSAEAARHIDTLVAAFCFDFNGAMYTNGTSFLPIADESSLPTRYYTETLPWICQHTSPFVQTMWGYLLNGRGVGRDPVLLPYNPVNPSSPEAIGFWTAEEVAQLHTELTLLTLPDQEPMLSSLAAVRRSLEAARTRHGGLILLSV